MKKQIEISRRICAAVLDELEKIESEDAEQPETATLPEEPEPAEVSDAEKRDEKEPLTKEERITLAMNILKGDK